MLCLNCPPLIRIGLTIRQTRQLPRAAQLWEGTIGGDQEIFRLCRPDSKAVTIKGVVQVRTLN